MIYIVSLIVLLYLVITYDLQGKTRQKNLVYNLVLIWFILVSGFAYNVGGDVPGYMFQYDEFRWSDIHSLHDLMNYRHRQPGWVAVNLICKLFTEDFLLFKLVEAIFVNVVVFRFIKKYNPYIFTGVLLYAASIYLNLNFNALRQAYAVGFFLLGFDYLIEKKYLKYYIFALLAFMFHSSAAICFVIPLLMMVKLNLKTLLIGASAFFVFIVFAKDFFLDMSSSVFLDLAMTNGQLTEEYAELGNKFLGDNYVTDTKVSIFGYIEIALQLTLIVIMVVFNNKYRTNMPPMIGILTVVYIVFFLLDSFIPVLFFRLMFYVMPFYMASLSSFCVDVCKVFNLKNKMLISLVLIMYFCYGSINALFAVNPRSGLTDLEQFYPYYSVFDKQVYPPRAAEWGWHK